MRNLRPSQAQPSGRPIVFASESGVALTEFALVLPLLAVLLFGMIEFGRAINYWIDATHLANEAARWAVVNQNPGSAQTPAQTLQQYVQSQATTDELKNGGTGSVPTGLAVTICFPSGADRRSAGAREGVGDVQLAAVHRRSHRHWLIDDRRSRPHATRGNSDELHGGRGPC